jgi:hypothetical protein
MIKLLLTFILCSISYSSTADDGEHFGFFVKSEVNGDDFINGVGSEAWLLNSETHFGIAVNSAIGNAQVTDIYGYQHDYIAWDFGVKFGYFSDVFIYAELGFDLGELILSDRDGEDDYERYDSDNLVIDLIDALARDNHRRRYDHENDVDAYFGAGIGVKLNQVVVEGFARYRQIDGEYWKADNQVFTGVKLTLAF